MFSQSPRVPSFLIIGAMKCATTTLYEQLIMQPGIFMPELKEPNFFSDDSQYFKGQDWYTSLFDSAAPGDILGEASTHYTKLPEYPDTLPRMRLLLPEVKLIYMMRHPIDRLVSQYIHEWSQGNISANINRAIDEYPALISYSRYSYQLKPFFDAYGRESLLPLFFESFRENSQETLETVCQFIGYTEPPVWQTDLAASNISSERIRKFPMYSLLVESSVASFLRRTLVPQKLRDNVKQRLQMKKRPELSESSLKKLTQIFDEDLAILGSWLGIEINCDNFKSVAREQSRLAWV